MVATKRVSLLALFSALALTLVLAGCGGASGSSSTNNNPPPSGATEFLLVNGSSGVTSLSIDSNTGALTQVSGSPFAAGTSPNRIALDPTGKVAYVTDLAAGASNIQSLSIGSSGAITVASTSNYAGTPGPIAIDPSGAFAYIVPDPSTNTQTISVFQINAASHALTPIAGQPTAIAGVPQAVTVDPSGKFVYIPIILNGTAAAVAGRARDPNSGALTVLTNSPFALSGTDPRSIAITGTTVLIANFGSNNLSVLSMDPNTGALTPAAGSPFGTGTGPVAVAVDPSGKFVFVANQAASTLSEFSMSAGALTPVTGSPFTVGASPSAVTVDRSGKFVYVVTSTGTSGFSLDATTGALTPIAGSPFAAGAGGTGLAVATP
jgi:DNA-binding beta-propeller fold protein YncE